MSFRNTASWIAFAAIVAVLTCANAPRRMKRPRPRPARQRRARRYKRSTTMFLTAPRQTKTFPSLTTVTRNSSSFPRAASWAQPAQSRYRPRRQVDLDHMERCGGQDFSASAPMPMSRPS